MNPPTPTTLTGAEPWRQIAATSDERTLMEYILTGWEAKGWHDQECPLWRWLDTKDARVKLLDLGCGLGRSLHQLRKTSDWVLVGYDTPEMINRAMESVVPGIHWETDWETLRQQRWTCVHACFVFQHVTPAAIAQYCRDLATMTDFIVIRGRDWNDHTRGPVTSLMRPLIDAGFTAHETERDGDHSTTVYRRE